MASLGDVFAPQEGETDFFPIRKGNAVLDWGDPVWASSLQPENRLKRLKIRQLPVEHALSRTSHIQAHVCILLSSPLAFNRETPVSVVPAPKYYVQWCAFLFTNLARAPRRFTSAGADAMANCALDPRLHIQGARPLA